MAFRLGWNIQRSLSQFVFTPIAAISTSKCRLNVRRCTLFLGSVTGFGFSTISYCESFRTSIAQRLLDVAYAGTDSYGTIFEAEEDAVKMQLYFLTFYVT